MTTYIRTNIEFDLSKLKGLSPEKSFEKVKLACLRELVKFSFDSNQGMVYFLESYDSLQKDVHSLPSSIVLYILTENTLDYIEDDGGVSEFHSMVPIKYHVEEVEGDMESEYREVSVVSEYMASILDTMPLHLGYLKNNASHVFGITSPKLNLDEKIQLLLKDQDLRSKIESKHDFLFEAIQAYESNKLHCIFPEAWPVKSIMRIIRENNFDELTVFSMICLKIQHERSQGTIISNNLLESKSQDSQQEPLHIGLFDTYQVYLDTMFNTLELMHEDNPYKERCMELFKEVSKRLESFMLSQLEESTKPSALRQNAWVNMLLIIKDIFHWVSLKSYSEHERKQMAPETLWDPLYYTYVESELHLKLNTLRKEPHYIAFTDNQIENYIRIFSRESGFDIERYMEILEDEVSAGIYFFEESPESLLFEKDELSSLRSHLKKSRDPRGKSYFRIRMSFRNF